MPSSLRPFRALRVARGPVSPDAAWVASTRAALLDRVRKDVAQAPAVSSRFRAWFEMAGSLVSPALRPATAVFAALVVLVGGSAATVSASQQAMPGQSLHRVKLFAERVRLFASPRLEERVRLHAEFADRRVVELKDATARQDAASVQAVAVLLRRDLSDLRTGLDQAAVELPPAKGAEVAALVDRRSAEAYKAVRESRAVPAAKEAAKALDDAQWVAAGASVKAIEVLAAKHQEDKAQVTVQTVADAIRTHVETVVASASSSDPLATSASTTQASTSTVPSAAEPIIAAVDAWVSSGASTSTSATTTDALLPQVLAQVKDATVLAVGRPLDEPAQAASSSDALPEPAPDASATSTSSVTSTDP
jgi:hypothetical protein